MNIKFNFFYHYLFVIFLFISSPSFSANRFWVGALPGTWNSAANWSNVSGGAAGFSVPGFFDIAIFDGGNITDCTIDINVSVLGFTINALYSGTISLKSGVTTTVASSGFSQEGGIFAGADGNISINGAFALSGGSFTSTQGTLQITSGYTFSGGTFKNNNGTVTFSTTQTITGKTEFYNLIFVSNGGVYTIANGTTISSSNNVTISGTQAYTINTGTLEIQGDLSLLATANNTVNGGTATFLFNGTGVQNIRSAVTTIIVGTNERVCSLPNIEINKASGSLNLDGVINLNGAFWKTTNGAALINPGSSTVNIISSVAFSGENLSLFNIHIYANSQLISLNPATYKLTSTNDVTINGGSFYQVNTGILEILGNLTLINTSTASSNGGTGTFLFSGTGVQNINSAVSSLDFVCALPSVQINKTAGPLNLTGIINFSGASWNTIAGAGLINPGTSIVNVLKLSTLSGQNINLYDLVFTGNNSTITLANGLVWTSTHLLTLAGGNAWYQINGGTINGKGDVLSTNINTSNNVGGNTILLLDGTANQLLTGSGVAGGGRLPQVQINKTGGTLTLSNNIISTDNNWTYIQGNVDATSNASTLDFYKASNIDGQGTSATMAFYHVIASGFITLSGDLNVDGNFTIRAGLNNRLDVSTSNYQLNIAGNWTNNNSGVAISFNQQNGKVIFDGGSAQALTLALPTDLETFFKVEINNTNGGLTLNAPVTISNNVNFIIGNIFSTPSNILSLNNLATSTGASHASFVSGPLAKTGNQAFTFPVGKSTVYMPIAISAPAINTHRFVAQYFNTDPNILYDVNNKDATLNHINQCQYWTLDRTIGASNVTVRLSWDAPTCIIADLITVRVARWDGTQWKDHGNGGTTGTTASGTLVSAAAVTAFSPFALASSAPDTPLPVELLDFAGQCDHQSVSLRWSTATEINHDYFTLERSKNGIDWINIAKITGAGNASTTQKYNFTDELPYDDISYYRLKQTDFDSKFTYSSMIKIANCLEGNGSIFISPNPVFGKMNLDFKGTINQISAVDIFNNLGKSVYHSEEFQPDIDMSSNPEGVYFIVFVVNSKMITEKFILEK